MAEVVRPAIDQGELNWCSTEARRLNDQEVLVANDIDCSEWPLNLIRAWVQLRRLGCISLPTTTFERAEPCPLCQSPHPPTLKHLVMDCERAQPLVHNALRTTQWAHLDPAEVHARFTSPQEADDSSIAIQLSG